MVTVQINSGRDAGSERTTHNAQRPQALSKKGCQLGSIVYPALA